MAQIADSPTAALESNAAPNGPLTAVLRLPLMSALQILLPGKSEV